MSLVHGCGQLFVRRENENIVMLLAKTVDESLICGHKGVVAQFLNALRELFDVGNTQREGRFSFNGCEFQITDDGSVKLSMYGCRVGGSDCVGHMSTRVKVSIPAIYLPISTTSISRAHNTFTQPSLSDHITAFKTCERVNV